VSELDTERRPALRVGIVGCGLIGHKRAAALGGDSLVGCFDIDAQAARSLAHEFGTRSLASFDELLALELDIVIVALPHDQLAEHACGALTSGSHVLVEKPAGVGVENVIRIAEAAESARRRVKVGFNHRFHPATAQALEEARSGRFGPILHMRARYGHGGRIGYEHEWRAQRAVSGGGELVDQGMHLFDLSYSLFGPLPLHSALLRTAFWPIEVEDNVVVILGDRHLGPWTLFHASWTEWKNLFSLEIYCREAKLQVDGLARSYGPQRLTIYAMKPALGPPDVETIDFPPDDKSWSREWRQFAAAVSADDDRPLSGDLESARYGWQCVEAAYARDVRASEAAGV
jgi:predicted dehydrogenase